MCAAVHRVGHRPKLPFPPQWRRRFNTAPGSAPLWSICCTASSCPKITLSGVDACSVRGEPCSGDHCPDEPQLCAAATELPPRARDHVVCAKVKHLDETGFRIGGRTRWLHVASTAQLTVYRVCAKRGTVWDHMIGIAVHDHWKPYYTMGGVRHALCNAHHLRELKALVDIDKQNWARRMRPCCAGPATP